MLHKFCGANILNDCWAIAWLSNVRNVSSVSVISRYVHHPSPPFSLQLPSVAQRYLKIYMVQSDSNWQTSAHWICYTGRRHSSDAVHNPNLCFPRERWKCFGFDVRYMSPNWRWTERRALHFLQSAEVTIQFGYRHGQAFIYYLCQQHLVSGEIVVSVWRQESSN